MLDQYRLRHYQNFNIRSINYIRINVKYFQAGHIGFLRDDEIVRFMLYVGMYICTIQNIIVVVVVPLRSNSFIRTSLIVTTVTVSSEKITTPFLQSSLYA